MAIAGAHRVVGWVVVACALSAVQCVAAERVAPVDLARHFAEDRVDLRAVGPGEYEWSLPTGAGQTLRIDLPALGIEPADYDEIRFDIMPLGSQVGLNVVLCGYPTREDILSWYLKFKTMLGQWSSGRFDLRLDDDGLYCGKAPKGEKAGTLRISLYRRILGLPGEPIWRKARFRNVRLVKRLISADFDLGETEVAEDPGEVSTTYRLHVKNLTDKPQKAKLELDSARTLRYFQASCPSEEFDLGPREEKAVPIRLFLSAAKAMTLPPLYSEPLIPRVSVPGVEDSDVIPLRGYRRFPMWGSVPIFNKHRWTPATLQAFLGAREKVLPKIADWRAQVVRSADEAMKYRWPVPDFGPPLHDQGYRCKKCSDWLRPATPTSFHKHICPKCGDTFENNAYYDRCWLMRYNSARASDVRHLALAYLITGKAEYAAKATEILLDYAAGYPKMPIYGTRSTSGASKLGANTLHSSYVIPAFAEGYSFLETAPCLDEEKRARIVQFLKETAFSVVRHSVEYNNQQAEHFRAYGSVGLATGFWPLAAEAIYGDFGWHELVEYGYSEDGIAHEAGAYHFAVFQAMNELAMFAKGQGVNLYTARFKRVFDGSLNAGLVLGGSGPYELAYRAYGDPRYLPTLAAAREQGNEITALHGILGLPSAERLPVSSVHMAGAGYVYLRRGTAADWLGIALNYIKPFDRGERDRLTTFFHRTGTQVDSTVGRITYGSPHAGWMAATAAHNCIVIDGADEQDADCQLIAFDPSPYRQRPAGSRQDGGGTAETPIAVVATNPASPLYDGVAQLRCVALLEDSFVVFDRVACDRPRTIDRYQYGKGTARLHAKASPVEPLPQALPKAGAFSQIQGGPCGKELRVDFENLLRMRVVSDGDMEAYKGLTVGAYQATPMEFTFVRRSGAEAAFLASFTLGKDKEPPALTILKSTPEEMVFEVKAPARAWNVTIRPKDKKVRVAAR